MFSTLLSVALGGALGASGRYLVNAAAMRAFGPGIPVATLAVNVIGSLAMGILVVVLAKKGGQIASPFLLTGLLGGFTTFSAFSLDTLTLFERGQYQGAVLYVVLSVGLSIGAVVLGVLGARMVMA